MLFLNINLASCRFTRLSLLQHFLAQRAIVLASTSQIDPLDTMASDLTLDSRATTSISRVAFALAVLFVSLRFYTRRRLKIQIGWDDWWILIGLLMTFLTYGLLLWSIWVQRSCLIPLLTMMRCSRGSKCRQADQQGA